MEHLHVLHREVRQVVQHHLIITLEEILAVERQVINFLAIHRDLAVLFQLRTRQLTDQIVKHRPFGQVEGRGIIHHRVTSPHQLHLRRLHHKLLHLRLHRHVARSLLQIDARYIKSRAASQAFQLIVRASCSIARGFSFDDKLRWMGWHFDVIGLSPNLYATAVRINCIASDNCAVRSHHRHHRAVQVVACERVKHLPAQHHLPLLLLRLLRCGVGSQQNHRKKKDQKPSHVD